VTGWTTNVSTAVAMGLSAGTQYWFNVLVRDVASNPSACLSSSATTSTVSVSRIIGHTNFDPGSVSDAGIANAAALDVYLEHASVGQNVIDGLATLEGQAARYLFNVAGHHVSWSSSNDPTWYVTHDGLGDNNRGNPGAYAKVSGFTSRITMALAAAIDVAMYKFCYIDTPSDGTDFFANTVRPAMESLQATYPDVVFVWWTMPIETTSALQRQIYNNAVRAYCSANSQWLLDIADLESHDETGAACLDGNGREILYSGYTTDGGHLNNPGSLKMAKAYWKLLSEIAKLP
jgi:hypothetical protein